MNDSIRNRIKLATVTVIHGDEADFGKGFFVPGGFILTAAHCVPWSGEGQMPLGDFFHVAIIAADGTKLTGEVIAVEVVADIAVIGVLDNQMFSKEAEVFDRFAESIHPLQMCGAEFPFGEDFPVHVMNHCGHWLSGNAAQWKENATTMVVETHPQITPGTSGSAVVNDSGEVVGVVSTLHGEEAGAICSCARPCQSLPVWLWRAIKTAEHELFP